MNYKIVLLLCFCCFSNITLAQKDTKVSKAKITLDEVEQYTLPYQDNEKLRKAEELRRSPDTAPRYAENVSVNITPHTHGTWETLPNGKDLWRLKIYSEGAKSLNLGFTKYFMPKGGSLILYTPDKETIRGPFTPADNEEHEQLWTPIISGEALVIEVLIPSAKRTALDLQLSYVNHDFIGFGKEGASALASGSCNVDVICGAADGWDIVDGYRDIIRSVAVISTGGGTFCTGFLVTNARQDCTPYFMTAYHCGISESNAPSLVTYWNFENSYCRQPDSPESGQAGDGELNDFNTGSIFRARSSATDFVLVELDDPVSPTANAFMAGWNAEFTLPTGGAIAVHHPSTDEKRISFENDQDVYWGNWGSGNQDIPTGNHVIVADWNIGTTEPGSSGSPLFDTNKRVIGQLHGGSAACGNDLYDSYGGIAYSWEGEGTPSTRLIDWLDPDGTGIRVIDGVDVPCAPDHCFNGVQDEDETDIDCGGASCIACPTCDDGIQNQGEEGVDCGGPCAAVCPTCDDGIQNGDEEDVDCGGSNCEACPCYDNVVTVTILFDNYPEETSWVIVDADGTVVASGGTYGSQADGSTIALPNCLLDGCYDFTINDSFGDGICCGYGEGSYTVTDEAGNVLASGAEFGSSETTNFCVSTEGASCNDGVQNGDETGIDCGGSFCAPCPDPIAGCTDEAAHNYNPDATEDDGSCETCSDGILNGDETDIDCGGSLCAACAVPGCTDESAHNYNPDATEDDGSCETCSDGILNGDETGVDCGGALCMACPVPGCTDATAHNYDPNATEDDGSCETCSDGILNGDETEIDCGGSLCDPCDTGECSYVIFDNNDFEDGWGIWNDGGNDVRRARQDSRYANSGTYCIRLRSNSGMGSSMITDALDLSFYEELTLDFSLYARSMESGDGFVVEIDNGNGFTNAATYTSGADFVNDTRYNETVIIDGPFSTATQLRIRCDANQKADYIYIDDVMISACMAGPEFKSSIDPKQTSVEATSYVTDLTLYPNPVSNLLNVSINELDADAQLIITDFNGKVLQERPLSKGQTVTQVNTTNFLSGCYFISIQTPNGKIKTERFIVVGD